MNGYVLLLVADLEIWTMLTRAILIFPDKQECVIFTVNKNISLLGITLCGSENNRYSVTISILKLDSGTVCLLRKFPSVFIAEGLHSFYGLRILFDDPIVIKKGIRYLIKASFSGANSCFGRNGQKFVTCSGINFSFGDCSANRSGTGVAQGQFPELFQTM